jgi:hypothetical protein
VVNIDQRTNFRGDKITGQWPVSGGVQCTSLVQKGVPYARLSYLSNRSAA